MRFVQSLLVCFAVIFSTVSFGAEAPDLSESAERQEFAGDVLLVGVPLAALAMTFWVTDEVMNDDKDGDKDDASAGFDVSTLTRMNGSPRHDLMLAMGRTLLATYTLKYAVGEDRPNGEDSHSFPSGHTSISFAGAEFIRKEYGWGWGTPAYLLAGFVGYTRVNAYQHYTWDVLAGATIGILANHDIQKSFSRLGSLSMGPTLAAIHPISGGPWRDENATTWAPAPALGLEFRF